MSLREEVGADLRYVDWYGQQLTQRRFVDCDLTRATLEEVAGTGCVFEECDLTEARLNGSTWTDSAFLRCRFRGTSLFGANLRACKLTGSSFEETAVLRPLVVDGGDWSFVSLRYQDLRRLDLTGLRLRDADLTGANLGGTVLAHVDLANATFHDTKLRGADLRGAQLPGVDLSRLDLADVKLDVTHAVQLAMAYGADVDWHA